MCIYTYIYIRTHMHRKWHQHSEEQTDRPCRSITVYDINVHVHKHTSTHACKHTRTQMKWPHHEFHTDSLGLYACILACMSTLWILYIQHAYMHTQEMVSAFKRTDLYASIPEGISLGEGKLKSGLDDSLDKVHMYVCVCMYVCMYVSVHVCVDMHNIQTRPGWKLGHGTFICICVYMHITLIYTKNDEMQLRRVPAFIHTYMPA
jgi:hypothetical protein